MKKLPMLIAILLWMHNAVAQTGLFVYTSTTNTSFAETPAEERYLDDLYNTGFLYILNDFSIYRENISDSIILKKSENKGAIIRNKVAKGKHDTLGSLYLKDKSNTKWLSRVHSYDKESFSFIEEPISQINWTMTNESKTIGSLQCFKATCIAFGRNWEAWYAPAIALAEGPWKLHGLPGLIVEARDSAGRYSFSLSKMESPIEILLQQEATALKEKLERSRFMTKQAFTAAEAKKKDDEKRGRMARMAAAVNKNIANINVKIYFPETIEKY